MKKDKALEELFLAKKPHFDDHDTFMANLTKRLDAVEFIHQHQEATVRRYKMAMIATFVIGIISGAITMAFILSVPADVPLFNFNVHTGLLLWFTEISRPVVAIALALLMTIGSISVIINIQEINNIMKMNKKTIITILLALVAVTGQAFQYRIVGNIGTNDFTGWLYLMNQSNKPYSDVDSLWVENGEVRDFEGCAQEPFLALLHSKGKQIVQFPCLFVEEGTVKFRPAAMTTIGAAYMGTPLNDEWVSFYSQFNTIEVATDEGRITQTEAVQKLDSLATPLVNKHRNDVLGAVIISFLEDLGNERLMEYITMLSPKQQSFPFIQDMSQTILAVQQTSEGAMFKDFTVEYNGKTVHLSDYVGHGQYVLADFWASWCGPCLREIPNIIAVYNKYKDCGLNVLGVAVWEKAEESMKVIEEKKIPYPQILNVSEEITGIYGIDAIPHTILFAPDGTILARGLVGENIEQQLKKIFIKITGTSH